MRHHLVRCVFAVGFVLAATGTGALAQETQTFTTIDIPGATSTVALDLNAAGDIVGSYSQPDAPAGSYWTGTDSCT